MMVTEDCTSPEVEVIHTSASAKRAAKLMRILKGEAVWQAATYWISLQSEYDQTVAGWSNGLFGIALERRPMHRRLWIITHLASGKLITNTCPTLRDAKARVEKIMPMANWNLEDPMQHMSADVLARTRDIVRGRDVEGREV